MTKFLLFHGDNQLASRKALDEAVMKLQSDGFSIIRWEAQEQTELDLEQALGTMMLFVEKRAVVISEVFSLRSKTKKDQLIEKINQSVTETVPILWWEKKQLTPTQLKKFPQAQPQHFPLSSSLFTWLDSIGQQPKAKVFSLLQKSLQQDEPEMCFHMLLRQLRLLIQIKDNQPLKLHPFAKSKLTTQAKKLTLEQLIHMHQDLCFIDFSLRKGQHTQSLSRSLQQCILHW